MNTSTDHLQLKLDDKTIETKTENYPDDAREAARWLAAYCREKCNRQISILVAKAKKLKFETDYSYWHKILTGKYFCSDPKTGKTIGSVQNFLQVVEELRKIERIEWRAGRPPFIETGTYHLIADFIDKKRQPGRVNKFGGIVGVTGSQKTASFKQYRMLNNHGKVVLVDSPEKPRMAPFITDLAVAYGEAASQCGEKKRSYITQAVNETKCIIVDNVQRLYREESGADQPIFSFLQKLQDDTDCTIILSYTPDFVRKLNEGLSRGYFEQFVGRMGGLKKSLVLPEFAPRDDILAIAEAYQFADAKKHIKYLESISREPGRIRALFDDLQDAKSLAESDKQPLSVEHLRMVRGEEESA
jgi:hypothetical protein